MYGTVLPDAFGLPNTKSALAARSCHCIADLDRHVLVTLAESMSDRVLKHMTFSRDSAAESGRFIFITSDLAGFVGTNPVPSFRGALLSFTFPTI